jgi:anaerobic selenocysteine-containing dehydrogenase
MNRLGAALTGEASDPPIKSLYVFGANPAASTPNARLIAEGLQREDLFTVVHELFITDTARYADIVLPATSQLEQVDLHKAYGHRYLQYNAAAMPPVGESKSNWDVMRLLAEAMGYEEPWLRQTAEKVIAEVLDATRATNPYFEGITLERLQAEGTVPLHFADGAEVPFANLRFPTPSGKLELRCDALAAKGIDPLPQYEPPSELAARPPDDTRLVLISGASHHFTSSSMANVPSLRAKEGTPYIEINPDDAAKRGISDGNQVVVSNIRGAFHVRAVVTSDVPSGVVVSPKGQWARLSPDGRNVNWTTSDAIADLGGQSTFHSNLVEVCQAVPAPTAHH